MQKTIYLKPTTRVHFYPARRGRLGMSLRIALGALLLGVLFVYGAQNSSRAAYTIMEMSHAP